ncbi:sporulation histidine kinase inhibitor Sda [Effusibacillus consociatus]|uniref:Sporulation histidine kinase inhibitor Sda n=1 Tax=Effusibacillus consociatus TaxID=1117041 RepID=A0ABV9Q553_9BACL
MRLLSDKVLLEAYKQAVELKLDEQFIQLLLKEINQRGLSLLSESYSA